jgi:hypothetical protein
MCYTHTVENDLRFGHFSGIAACGIEGWTFCEVVGLVGRIHVLSILMISPPLSDGSLGG